MEITQYVFLFNRFYLTLSGVKNPVQLQNNEVIFYLLSTDGTNCIKSRIRTTFGEHFLSFSVSAWSSGSEAGSLRSESTRAYID
jgi:hypothetical protein